jgi:hypothetical protein
MVGGQPLGIVDTAQRAVAEDVEVLADAAVESVGQADHELGGGVGRQAERLHHHHVLGRQLFRIPAILKQNRNRYKVPILGSITKSRAGHSKHYLYRVSVHAFTLCVFKFGNLRYLFT